MSIHWKHHVELRYIDLKRPSISLWEQRAMCRILCGDRQPVSEALIFQAIETQHQFIVKARSDTRL